MRASSEVNRQSMPICLELRSSVYAATFFGDSGDAQQSRSETLSSEHGQFAFSNTQPTGMDRYVMLLNLLGDTPGFGR